MQSGKKLEEMFFEYFMPDKYFGFRKASEKEDIEEGTDFFCDGLRFDLTEDFRGKDHMVQDKQLIYYHISRCNDIKQHTTERSKRHEKKRSA